MQLLSVLFVFIVAATVSILYLSKLSNRFWELAEYAILTAAFCGIIAAVADISASRKEQVVAVALAASQSAKAGLNYRTEWVMNSCDVCWDDVLNQTNVTPSACMKDHPTNANETCEASCRAAHFVGQHRMQAYSPSEEYSAAEGLYANICYEGASDIGMCERLKAYRDAAAKHSELSQLRTFHDYVANHQASYWIQLLFALTLGVQAGKIRRDMKAN